MPSTAQLPLCSRGSTLPEHPAARPKKAACTAPRADLCTPPSPATLRQAVPGQLQEGVGAKQWLPGPVPGPGLFPGRRALIPSFTGAGGQPERARGPARVTRGPRKGVGSGRCLGAWPLCSLGSSPSIPSSLRQNLSSPVRKQLISVKNAPVHPRGPLLANRQGGRPAGWEAPGHSRPPPSCDGCAPSRGGAGVDPQGSQP